MKEIFSLTFLIVGCIVGAGFASGSEINLFFAKFGNMAYFFLFILFCLLFISIYKLLMIKEKYNIRNISHFCLIAFGRYSKMANICLFVCYLLFSSIMVAGLVELFGLMVLVVIFLLAFFILCSQKNRLTKINKVLVPCVVVFILILLLLNLDKTAINNAVCTISCMDIINLIFYASLNMLLSVGAILSLSKIKSKTQIVISSISSSLLVCLICLVIIFLIQGSSIGLGVMPIRSIAENINVFASVISVLIIGTCCLTTFFAVLLSMQEQVQQYKKVNSKLLLTILLFCIFILSFLGFENVLSFAYVLGGSIAFVFLLSLWLIK